MIPTLLIGLREGLEAGLVAGILIAYLTKAGRRDLLPRLWTGIGFAALLALVVGAVLTFGPYGMSFQAQEILGGGLSIVAVGMVTWMILWMGRHSRSLTAELHGRMDQALAGAGWGLVVLGTVSVGRESVETALFVWASVNSGQNAVLSTIGAVIGIALAIGLAVVISRGMLRIDLARFFFWTGIVLVVVAAGVLSYGIGDLQSAGVLPGGKLPVFSIAALIPVTSWYGAILAGVFNFTPEPTLIQLIAWGAYIVIVLAGFLRNSLGGRRRGVAPSGSAPFGSSPSSSPPPRTAEPAV